MSDKTIDEVTPDTNVTGVEKMPVSDNGTAKSVTIEKVKDFVLAKINALDAASDIAVASDGVFIKKDGAMKPLSAQTLASAVVNYAFGSDTASSLAGTDIIVLSKSGVSKKTTLADLAEFVKNNIQLDPFEIHELAPISGALTGINEFAVSQFIAGAWGTVKTSLSELMTYIVGKFPDNASESASALTANDSIFFKDGTDGTVKMVKKSDAGLGIGNVVGPNTNTANKIPQWNGANSKTLKDGLTLSTNVLSTSTDADVPTAKAVYDISVTKIAKPATNTANNIPQWNGNGSGALKDGLALSTEVSSSSTDSQVPTAKAVNDLVNEKLGSGYVVGPNSSVNGNIPKFNGTSGNELSDGYSVTKYPDGASSDPIGTSSTDDEIPTSKAVYKHVGSLLDNAIIQAVPSPSLNELNETGTVVVSIRRNGQRYSSQGSVGISLDAGDDSNNIFIPSVKRVDKKISSNQRIKNISSVSDLSAISSTLGDSTLIAILGGALYFRANASSSQWYVLNGSVVP